MIDQGKKNILGVYVNAVDYEAAAGSVIEAAFQKRGYAATALAVHGVMTGVLDPVHRYRLNRLDLVTPDGQPVRWALNWLHSTCLDDRVYGPELMLRICERAAEEGLPVYLYGSRREVLENLQTGLCRRFPRLVLAGAQPSRFRQATAEEMAQIVNDIRQSGAAITFVGLGCPRQEVWVYENREALSMPLIAVGAAFDFHAGALPQAPARLQGWGLEWFFRLSSEPRRLWRRYLALNPLFLWYLVLQKAGIKQFNPEGAAPPSEMLRYT